MWKVALSALRPSPVQSSERGRPIIRPNTRPQGSDWGHTFCRSGFDFGVGGDPTRPSSTSFARDRPKQLHGASSTEFGPSSTNFRPRSTALGRRRTNLSLCRPKFGRVGPMLSRFRPNMAHFDKLWHVSTQFDRFREECAQGGAELEGATLPTELEGAQSSWDRRGPRGRHNLRVGRSPCAPLAHGRRSPWYRRSSWGRRSCRDADAK